MARERNKKRTPPILNGDTAEKIVEAALAHPSLGSDRLARLLSDGGVDVSRGMVYRVLRNRGLQTRKLRSRFLEDQAHYEKPNSSCEFQEAPDQIAEPIQEQPREAPGPPVFMPEIEYTAPKPAEEKPMAPASFAPAYIPIPTGTPPIEKMKVTHPWNERWLFGSINLLLTAFLVYFGVRIGFELYDETQKTVVAATPPPALEVAPEAVKAADLNRPLSNYRVIIDRNLFSSASQSASDPARETAGLKSIGLAGSEIGLKLIGTAFCKDSRKNYAVLEITKTRSQEIFREGETVANFLIKRILRNNVIIQTAKGEERLSVDEKLGSGVPAPPVQPVAAAMSFSEVPRVYAARTGARFEITRNEIAQALPGLRQMIEESNSAENRPEGQPDGFSVGRLRARDAFFRIGFRSGDIIKSIDGEAVQSGDDAEQLIERLAEGGDFSIMVERRGQLESLNLTIR